MNAKDKAVATLDGMREIAAADMLTHNEYVTEVRVPAREKAICGGRKACAVGSCYIAYGVRPVAGVLGDPELPGVHESERADFMQRRPGLRIAYDALNVAALAYVEAHPRVGQAPFNAPIEALFEGSRKARKDMLSIIADARRRVVAGSVV